MLVTINELPDSARVWIYQSDKNINANQKSIIEEQSFAFCSQWVAHGANLKSASQLVNDRFLVLAIDEGLNSASGCSIDSSLHFVSELGDQLDLNFLDRTQVTFLVDNSLISIGLNNLSDEIERGNIKSSTITFNLQAKNMKEYRENWMIPAADTWMKRYFK